MMDSVKVLRVRFQNISLFKDGVMEINLIAKDKVSDAVQAFNLHNSIYTQKLLGFVGINASGKTTSLKLLYFAMNIIINNSDLNTDYAFVKGIIQDKTIMTVDFFYQEKYYTLKSIIGKRNVEENSKKPILYFVDECLISRDKKTVTTKKQVFDFPEKHISETIIRGKLSINELSLLKDDVSIVIKATRTNQTYLEEKLMETNVTYMGTRGIIPGVILNAFDSSLEELSCTSDGNDDYDQYIVKFKNRKEVIKVNSQWDLVNIISSGTIKGQNMIFAMVKALSSGGYLIVDEFENHLNKEIIKMILDIFKNVNSNPYGACLIFSTHYSEILDYMDRKDNIYITRRQETNTYAIELLNYATQVARNDVKKSEVILSNYVKGTAPLYENMKILSDTICKLIHNI